MRIGLQVSSFKWQGGDAQIGAHVAEIAKAADAASFYSLWVMDHFFQINGIGPATDPMLESYTTLGYMAAVTKQIKLGTMVTGVIYRYPGLLAKTVTTLDVLSGGRAYLGIGAAWNDEESAGLGVPFPSTKVRFEQLEEALQIVHQMWSGEAKPYQGAHFQLGRTLNSPAALSKPHPPILIGGTGEKKTLRMVAQYADACNIFAMGVEGVQQKLDVLKGHCEALGRPYEAIEKTVLARAGTSSSAEIVEMCRAYAAIGVQHMIFGIPDVETIKPLETFGKEIIPAVAGL